MGVRRPTRVALATVLILTPLLASGAWAGKPRALRDDPLVELGRRLFFDPVVSPSGMRACADCHDPEHGYSDRAAHSLDVGGRSPHHSQTLVDVADSPTWHWHGEMDSIAAVVKSRMAEVRVYYSSPEDSPEDGPPVASDASDPDLPDRRQRLAAKGGRSDTLVAPGVDLTDLPRSWATLQAAGRYGELLGAAFGDRGVNLSRVARAIEAYCRSIRSGASPYDRFAGGDTVLHLDGVARSGTTSVGFYSGWARTDVPYETVLELPAGFEPAKVTLGGDLYVVRITAVRAPARAAGGE